ncbi:hypothetical protein GMOD_00001621 [Pyrenophora seminiperda CCB06]|uniref:Uncharacterized protein n=1 Tax=Pyrenophora seminiperda CCB06 TaxID=1302712 RepID=A0A3M7LZP6_9PLEO|nr:hypothetical protein GMOD_00001621 [Pyrenophora seminiperda CCB06]
MASYFDLPPQKAATATGLDHMPQDERKQLGRMSSLMSPAVTQILQGLGDEHSDSSSSEEDLSDEEDQHIVRENKKHSQAENLRNNKQKHVAAQAPRPSSLSPCRSNSKSTNRGSSKSKSPSKRTEKDSPAKAKLKQPHMTRFHSLRSMLFQQRIEDRLKTATEEDCKKEQTATERWQRQHEERQMHRPKTPEKDGQPKNGIGSRLKMTMRRMTTRDSGSMEKIREDGAPVEFKDRSSTASSDNEQEQQNVSRSHQDSDNESIKNADVEELVRWVSQREGPSDGETRKGGVVEIKEDSGHESLGNEDVDDPVRHGNADQEVMDDQEEARILSGYSDASTESDSELQQVSSDEEEDAEDLVRWISHREGPKAGPVRRNLDKHDLDTDVGEHYDSDVPELGRWFKRYDGTSGESAPASLVDGSTDEVPVEEYEEEEEERGRPRSRESVDRVVLKGKRHMTDDDVDDLVRWISRKTSKQRPQQPHDQHLESVNREEEEEEEETTLRREDQDKKHVIGMTIVGEDQGSLSNTHVEELVQHARKTSGQADTTTTPVGGGIESGDLRTLRTTTAKDTPRDSQTMLHEKRRDLDEMRRKKEEEEGGMRVEDVEGLVEHVRRKGGGE